MVYEFIGTTARLITVDSVAERSRTKSRDLLKLKAILLRRGFVGQRKLKGDGEYFYIGGCFR